MKLTPNNTMVQWVNEDTRYRGEDRPSRLDLVFTKEVELAKDIVFDCPFGKSDHVILEIEMEGVTEERDETHRKKRRNFAKANFPELRNFFEQINWKEIERLKSVQQKYDFFLRKYEEGIIKYVPEYKVKEKGKKDWFNKRCATAKAKRDKAFKRLMKRPTQENKTEYKLERNEYVKIRREEEMKFEKDIVDKCKEEPKLFYRYINGKIKSKESVTRLRENNKVYEDPKEMSELLNKNFQKVFTKESEFQQLQRERRETEIREVKVCRDEIMKLMKDLEERKATGPDQVSGHILKECRHQLIEPIHDIIRCSLETGKVPKEWKRADIVPIFKNGNKEVPLNYRPVSLTSVICKICEKIIKKQWTTYLEREGILTDRQFGFRKDRSCVTNLLSFYSRVIDITQERDGWTDCIYLDLKKAFDKVPHKRLLWKLENIGGLKGVIKDWIEDYLDGREMRTVVRDEKSEWREVTSGVPKESVLARIMFLIYGNTQITFIMNYEDVNEAKSKCWMLVT